MEKRRRNITYLVIIAIMIILTVVYEQHFSATHSEQSISQQAQDYFNTQSDIIDKLLDEVGDDCLYVGNLWGGEYTEDYLIFVRSEEELKYWNSNRISPDHIPYSPDLRCKQIDNAWFIYKSAQIYHYRVDVLLNIKNDYSVINEYFNNEESTESVFSQTKISLEEHSGYSPILGDDNHPIFYYKSIEFDDENKKHNAYSTCIRLNLFFLMLLFLSSWHQNKKVNVCSVLIFGVGVILAIHYLNLIPIFNHSQLFLEKIKIGSDRFETSIGSLAIYSSFWIVLCYTTSRILIKRKFNQWKSILLMTILLFSFCTIIQAYINIIKNTSLNLQLYQIRRLSSESLWIFGVVILFISGFGRITYSAMVAWRGNSRTYLYPLVAFVFCAFVYGDHPTPLIFSTVMLLFMNFMINRQDMIGQFMFLNLLLTSIFLSLMMTVITSYYANHKNEQSKELLLKNLPAPLLYERDYVIEDHLIDLWAEMSDDKTLLNISQLTLNSSDYYANYLRTVYFSSFLKEYDTQVIVCKPDDYLMVEGYSNLPVCYNFFEDQIKITGERIDDTGFYWQNNNNGRVSYFCQLELFSGTAQEISIFVELESPILSDGNGYPEMLKEQKSVYKFLPRFNSYARYVDGKLINSLGDYIYPPNDKWLGENQETFYHIDFDFQTHSCYQIAENSSIVVSERKITIMHYVYAYIYNFLMYYLSFLLIHILTQRYHLKFKRTINRKIRLFIFSILFLSLLFVVTTSILYPISLHKENQTALITEKGESFLSGLSHELGGVNNIKDVSKSSLQGLLQSLSNILFNDVHIYDLDGRLYTSSRPQIFNYGLQGNMMSPKAYCGLKFENLSSQKYREAIGKNEYKSSYFVLSNATEEPIAYINVPFFSSQEDLRKNITDLIVLLVNIYLVLVILVVVFTFLSVNTITKPLLIIQEGLSKTRLGSNEKIAYHRNDEIGRLVEKYNEMIDDLNISTAQLIKSEREGAWQGMARQIAHEIKNPLTPMRLSIQHLARTKQSSPEVFDDYFDKTATTLIEQIDNLSNIASSFSTFAKISDGISEPINLLEQLTSIVTLFEQSGSNITCEDIDQDFYVFMDKNHFRQIFNNLIKNALQAIPITRAGNISIYVELKKEMVFINIKDNGVGIKTEMRDKIFEPNFTTKNSGMGLGLAISQKMAMNAGGHISFSSNKEEGTTFVVSLPLTTKDQINY